MRSTRSLLVAAIVTLAMGAAVFTTACGSSGGHTRTQVHYGAGYRGYYRDPWRYNPVYIDAGPGIDDTPVASPLPEMGMPDFGGMDMDMGGFDF